MILCLALVQRSIPNRSPDAQARRSYRARSRLPRCESEYEATAQRQQFTALMRLFHWLTAALVLTMLGIGVAMVASLADYHRLVSIHRPLGILILIVVVIRYVNRRLSTLPPFPATMSPRERFGRLGVRTVVVCLAGCTAARRLGDVVSGELSHHDVRLAASLPHTSPQRNVVRSVAQGPHGIGLPLVLNVPRPFWGRFVSHVGRARRNLQPYGAVESSCALATSPGQFN